MQFEIDPVRAKSIARAIQKRCKTAGAKIAYGQALDGLAEGLGYRDWNTLSAQLDTASTPAHETPAAEIFNHDSPAIVVPGHVRSDDHVHSCDFDASVYLAAHPDDTSLADTLRQLVADGFSDSHTVDHFVRSADTGDGAIDALRDHCRAHDGIGFSAWIDRELTLAWIRTQRPGAYAQAKDLVREDDRDGLERFEALLFAAPDRIFEEPGRLALARAMTEGNQPGFIDHPGATYLHSATPSQMLSLYPDAEADPTGPTADLAIRAQARADDGSVATAFDAAPYLAELTRPRLAETLRDLGREGWGCDYTSDEIARALSDRPGNELLERVIDRSADIDPATGETIGFTVEIEPADVVAWLKTHAPDLLVRMVGEQVIAAPDRDTERRANLDRSLRPLNQRPRLLDWATGADPDAPDPDPSADLGGNTEIGYLYRDASNYKARRKLILQGPLTDAEIAEIKTYLDEGEYFIPGQIGLEDLQDSFVGCLSWWDPDNDHVWHELEYLERSDARPNTQMTARELLRAFREVVWDDSHKPECYDRMVERHQAHHGGSDAPREPITVWGETREEAIHNALSELRTKRGYGPHPMIAYVARDRMTPPEPIDVRGYRFADATQFQDVVGLMNADGTVTFSGALETLCPEADWRMARLHIESVARPRGLEPAFITQAREEVSTSGDLESAAQISLGQFADSIAETPEAARTSHRAWPLNIGRSQLTVRPSAAHQYTARCYAFLTPDGTPVHLALLSDGHGVYLRGWKRLDYGAVTWSEAESMLFAAASGWGLTPN